MNVMENLKDPASCLNKAALTEPIFVLRAKDPVAPAVIRIWASLSVDQPPPKRAGAFMESQIMERWHRENVLGEEDVGVLHAPTKQTKQPVRYQQLADVELPNAIRAADWPKVRSITHELETIEESQP